MIKKTTVPHQTKLQRKFSSFFTFKWKDFNKVPLFSETLNNESTVLLPNTEEQQ